MAYGGSCSSSTTSSGLIYCRGLKAQGAVGNRKLRCQEAWVIRVPCQTRGERLPVSHLLSRREDPSSRFCRRKQKSSPERTSSAGGRTPAPLRFTRLNGARDIRAARSGLGAECPASLWSRYFRGEWAGFQAVRTALQLRSDGAGGDPTSIPASPKPVSRDRCGQSQTTRRPN